MSRIAKQETLRAKEQEAFRRKQDAYKDYSKAKSQANEAYKAMRSAWEKRCETREIMNHEFDILQAEREYYHSVWDEYNRIRNANSSLIESLRTEADHEHEEMKSCFDRASDAYTHGNKAEAPIYAAKGHEHKKRRDELNAKISTLIQEIRTAKAHACQLAPQTDSSDFHKAKERFEDAKAKHESAQDTFKYYKAKRDSFKLIFDSAQTEHIHLRETFFATFEEPETAN